MKGRWLVAWKTSASGPLQGFSIKDDYEGSKHMLRCVEWLAWDDGVYSYSMEWVRTK